jgi:hypothetical protein
MSGNKSGTKTLAVSDELYERLVRFRGQIESETGKRITMAQAMDIYIDMVASK